MTNIRKSISLSLILAGFAMYAQAQYIDDIIRYSQPNQGATARFIGLGNAQNALGGDISSISGNPAGLGFFNQSDISLSIDYMNNLNRANYFGTSSQRSEENFSFNQIGAVFNIPSSRSRGSDLATGWLNFNIGIGYNRTNNFNGTVGYTGINPDNSIANFMTYEPIGGVYNNFGWDAGLIDEHGSGNYDIPMTGVPTRQTSYFREGGFQSETNLSFGANYSNKLYLGASVGFHRLRHSVDRLFMEDGFIESAWYINQQNPNSRFINPSNPDYSAYNPLLDSEYEYDDQYWANATGNGFNAKLGLIYKPTTQLQLGLSFTSPTWYNMRTDYQDYFGVTNYLVDGSVEDFVYDVEDLLVFDYNLRTPYRINGGVAYIFDQGLISADVEFVDYASMSFSSSDFSTDNNMNTAIANTFKSNVNFRVGGEYVFAPSFLVRAGYNYNGGPYQNFSSNIQTVSAGLGYRVNNFYIDAAYQNAFQDYGLTAYQLDDLGGVPSPVANINNTRNSVILTAGFKF